MPEYSGDESPVPCNCCGADKFKPAVDCKTFKYVRCVSCGLVQRNPQPLTSDIIERYSRTYGEDYLSYELKNEGAFFDLQRLALKDAGFFTLEASLLSGGNAPSVLDVGCASGSVLVFLRERGWRVTGVEISPCAEYAKKERGLDVRNIPLEENSFADKSFDVVLASHLIEHLNDPRSFLTETRRILKDDGHIFITTPNIDGFQARIFRGNWRSAIFDHLYLFSISTLKKLLKKCGFTTEKISTWGGLASGSAPLWLKKIADPLAKRLRSGDVMIVKAKKLGGGF